VSSAARGDGRGLAARILGGIGDLPVAPIPPGQPSKTPLDLLLGRWWLPQSGGQHRREPYPRCMGPGPPVRWPRHRPTCREQDVVIDGQCHSHDQQPFASHHRPSFAVSEGRTGAGTNQRSIAL